MHGRYPHPLTEQLFHPDEKIQRWTQVAKHQAKQYAEETNQPDDVIRAIERVRTPNGDEVRHYEQMSGHDVAAFLHVLTKGVPGNIAKFFHYGLTSSDIVDNAHFLMLRQSITDMTVLCRKLNGVVKPPDGQGPIPGRTHGQIAEVTSWDHRLYVWRSVMAAIIDEMILLKGHIRFTKTPGPTGDTLLRRKKAFSGMPLVPSTQVIPRDYQLRWAALYLRLCTHVENLAMQIRLASRWEVDEVREHARMIGSSSMPHKTNPVSSENLCGMARVARGHFIAIAESVVLWEDRDISNSVVERTSVVDLAAITEYMLTTMHGVMSALEWRKEPMVPHEAFTALIQSLLQMHGDIGPSEAGLVCKRLFREVEPHAYHTRVAEWLKENRPNGSPDNFLTDFNRYRELYMKKGR